MTKNYLLNNVRLPFQIVRGSFETRQQKAAQFTHKIVNELSGQIDYEGVHLSKLGRMLKRLLPDNFNLFVRKNSDKESYAQLDVMLNKDNYIAGEFLKSVVNINRITTDLGVFYC